MDPRQARPKQKPGEPGTLDPREDALIDEEDLLDRRLAERVVPSDRPVEFDADAPLPDGAREGKVVSMHGDHFRVEDRERQRWFVHLAKKMLIRERRFQHPVAVGDDIVIQPQPTGATGEPHASLVTIRPRRTWLSRPAARTAKRRRDAHAAGVEQVVVANVEQIVITTAVGLDDDTLLRTNLLDRFLVAAERGSMRAAIAINKCDLIPPESQPLVDDVLAIYRRLGVPIELCSAREGRGIEWLRELLHGRTSVFAGPSGAGKSSLLNAVQPGLELRTGDVNARTGRGRHTTTTVQLLTLDVGGWVVDTPGVREFGLHELRPGDAFKYFSEIEAAAAAGCAFRDCSHSGREQGCAVIAAVEAGDISLRRYESFLALRETLG